MDDGLAALEVSLALLASAAPGGFERGGSTLEVLGCRGPSIGWIALRETRARLRSGSRSWRDDDGWLGRRTPLEEVARALNEYAAGVTHLCATRSTCRRPVRRVRRLHASRRPRLLTSRRTDQDDGSGLEVGGRNASRPLRRRVGHWCGVSSVLEGALESRRGIPSPHPSGYDDIQVCARSAAGASPGVRRSVPTCSIAVASLAQLWSQSYAQTLHRRFGPCGSYSKTTPRVGRGSIEVLDVRRLPCPIGLVVVAVLESASARFDLPRRVEGRHGRRPRATRCWRNASTSFHSAPPHLTRWTRWLVG